jgi:hypothetical protein
MKENKIAILTTFYDYDNAYSLCLCVEDQLRMFLDNGYKIKILVDEAFKSPGGYWSHENLSYGFLPAVARSNEGEMPENWKEQVSKLKSSLKTELEGYQTVITHDVVLQPAHILFNVAARQVADELDLRWLHWSHSPTAPQVLCNIPEISKLIEPKFPNSLYCYPNDWDRKRVARNYGCELDEVKCVHHPSDFISLLCGDAEDFNEKGLKAWKLTKDLVDEFDILSADVISAYPCRLDRGKQPEFNIKTMASIKKLGRTVRMIIFDFHSTGGDKVTYRDELKQIGKKWGLTEKELIFISEWKPETHYNVPRAMIMNLKKMSDFHMHPSNTETYSLVVQESMATKNFCVLNYHLPVMADIYGIKNCLYEPFGASVNVLDGENGTTNLNIENEEAHFTNLANKILYFVENNPVLNQWRFIRQKRGIQYIFEQELQPLLSAEKLGKARYGTPK